MRDFFRSSGPARGLKLRLIPARISVRFKKIRPAPGPCIFRVGCFFGRIGSGSSGRAAHDQVYHMSRYGATKATPFELVYDQEAISTVEVNLDAYRLAKQNDISAIDYHDLMMNSIDEVTNKRLKALKEIEKDKI
jgi:hypothetical protein